MAKNRVMTAAKKNPKSFGFGGVLRLGVSVKTRSANKWWLALVALAMGGLGWEMWNGPAPKVEPETKAEVASSRVKKTNSQAKKMENPHSQRVVPIFFHAQSDTPLKPNELVVKFRTAAELQAFLAKVEKLGGRVLAVIPRLGAARIGFDTEEQGQVFSFFAPLFNSFVCRRRCCYSFQP